MEHIGCSDQTGPCKIITCCLLKAVYLNYLNPHKRLGQSSFSLDDNLPSTAYAEFTIFKQMFSLNEVHHWIQVLSMTKQLRFHWHFGFTDTLSQFSECDSNQRKVHQSEDQLHLSCTSYSFYRWLPLSLAFIFKLNNTPFHQKYQWEKECSTVNIFLFV